MWETGACCWTTASRLAGPISTIRARFSCRCAMVFITEEKMRQIFTIVALICAGFAAGCQSAPEKHYPIQGEVISVEVGKKLITVKHGDIPGLMPAMTMMYQVAEPKQIETLQAGAKVTSEHGG